MGSRRHAPGDPERPASARVYDYLLGGGDWYGPDRDLAVRLEGIYPGLRKMARSNQVYLGHAVLWASSRLGIRQYLDLGSGFPSASSVRDIAQAADRDAVIACVDHDPLVAGPDGYGPVLDGLGVKNVTMTLADIRDISDVLAAPGVGGLLDFGQPVLVVAGLVLYHMSARDARRVMKGYADVLVPGSAVVATVIRNDEEEVSGRLQEMWRADTGQRTANYALADLEGLFGGLEIQPPGVGPIAGRRPGWKDAKAEERGVSYVIGGIGVKPLPQRLNKRPAR